MLLIHLFITRKDDPLSPPVANDPGPHYTYSIHHEQRICRLPLFMQHPAKMMPIELSHLCLCRPDLKHEMLHIPLFITRKDDWVSLPVANDTGPHYTYSIHCKHKIYRPPFFMQHPAKMMPLKWQLSCTALLIFFDALICGLRQRKGH